MKHRMRSLTLGLEKWDIVIGEGCLYGDPSYMSESLKKRERSIQILQAATKEQVPENAD